jgi:hypothetical protein
MLMNKSGAEVDSLTKARWEFITRCWEYNVRIWKDTFLGDRISNPLLFKLVKQVAIPFGARVASVYYGMKHGPEMEEAIWKMANA